MNFHDTLANFGNSEFVPDGWYWLADSRELKKKTAKAAEIAGKKLVIYRSESGAVYGLDAHCPHMGAHLCDGKVEGEAIRCPFHFWKFDNNGACTDIPVGADHTAIERLNSYKIREHLGLIWVWTGDPTEEVPLPLPEELEDGLVSTRLGTPFEKASHPNVVMVNAIDAHHFTSVHQLVVELNMKPEERDAYSITFDNTTPCPPDHWLFSPLRRFYKKALTYNLKYWWGHTGAVTLGPDFLHFHIIFALRPGMNGSTQGQTILLTKNRKGMLGKAINACLLEITRWVGNYFAKGDTVIFQNIDFAFKNPIKADKPIVHFVRHYEKMRSSFFKQKSMPSEEIKWSRQPEIQA